MAVISLLTLEDSIHERQGNQFAYSTGRIIDWIDVGGVVHIVDRPLGISL